MSRPAPAGGARRWLPAAAGLLALALPAAAQVVPSGSSSASFSLDLSNPGARSLGMGGAFSGLADDATAAFANPAGLTVLTRPEVSVELRRWEQSVPFSRLAVIVGPPLRFEEEVFAVAESERTDLSFASYVHPVGRWALAVYHHRLASFETGLDEDSAFTSRTALEIGGTGIAAAYRLSAAWSLGASAVVYHAELDSLEERLLVGSRLQRSEQAVDDRDAGFGLGVLWRPGGRWSAGAFYRSALDFEVAQTSQTLTPPAEVPASSVLAQTAARESARLAVPESYGIGAAWRPLRQAVVTLDVAHLLYSRTTDSFRTAFGFLGEFVADDVVEVRAGVEYSFWSLRTIPALRLGAWYEPDHKIRFETAPLFRGTLLDVFGPQFPPGDDELHWTAGFGLVFADRVQVDAAADFSDRRDTFSLSGVVRF